MKKKMTALLVEDSPTQLEQLTAQLESYSMEVITANEGPTALRVAYEQQPDIIILDVNLPSMSGYQVCSRLKRDDATAHIPVIILTTLDSPDDMLNGLSVGANDYIPKDEFATQNLVQALRSMGLIDSLQAEVEKHDHDNSPD